MFSCPALNLTIGRGKVVSVGNEYMVLLDEEYNVGKMYQVLRSVPHFFQLN
jgi:hypothetical protein